MGSIDRAAEAIRTATIEGPVRARTLSALAQVDLSGRPFKLFLEGTRRQADAVIRTLRDAGIIERVSKSAPGVKTTYRVAEIYKVRLPARISAKPVQDAHEEGVRTTVEDNRELISELYDILPAVEESWKSEEARLIESLKDRALAHGVDVDGKIGAAVELIISSLVYYSDGLTVRDFGLELEEVSFSDRTLKNALAALKTAGIIEVIGGGPKVAIYRAVI